MLSDNKKIKFLICLFALSIGNTKADPFWAIKSEQRFDKNSRVHDEPVVSLLAPSQGTNFQTNELRVISDKVITNYEANALGKTFILNNIATIADDIYLKNKGPIEPPNRGYQTIKIGPTNMKLSKTRLVLEGQIICSRTISTFKSCPNMADLPLTRHGLLKMTPGDFVILPVKGRFLVPISNKSFSLISNYDKNFHDLVDIHSSSFASDSISGHLYFEGTTNLAIIRSKNGARVIWGLGRSAGFKSNLGLSASHITRAVFYPVTYLEKIRNLKTLQRIKTPGQASEYFNTLRQVKSEVKSLADYLNNPTFENKSIFNKQFSETTRTVDSYLADLNDYITNNTGALEEKIKKQENIVHKIISEINEKIITRHNNAVRDIKRFATKSLNLFTGITLDHATLAKLTIIKDLSFDLENELGQQGFDYAISGMVKFATGQKNKSQTSASYKQSPTYDLSIAENIALSESKKDQPAITINQIFLSRILTKKHKLSFTLLSQNLSFESKDKKELIKIYNPDTNAYDDLIIDSSSFSKNSNNRYVESQTDHLAYIHSPANSSRNGIFYSKSITFNQTEPEKSKRAAADLLNILGNLGIDLGVQNTYQGKNNAITGYEISVGLKQAVLKRLLSHQYSNIKTLWEAFSTTVRSFDNKFGLPYLDLGVYQGSNSYADFNLTDDMYSQHLDGLTIKDYMARKCEDIRRVIGNQWCRWFANEFSHNLFELQSTEQSEKELLRFIKNQGSKKYLVNTVRKDFITRLIIEIFYRGLDYKTHNLADYFYLNYRVHAPENVDLIYKREFTLGDDYFYQIH